MARSNRPRLCHVPPISPKFRAAGGGPSHAHGAVRHRRVNLSLMIKWRARRHFANGEGRTNAPLAAWLAVDAFSCVMEVLSDVA